MTIKAVMVDVDGVLIVQPDGLMWTASLEQDLGISASRLQTAFFEPHWSDVVRGRASLRERLGPVLLDISPHVTCDVLIDYWFTNDAHVNTALLDELASIRASGIEVHLATVQDHERARYIWQELDFCSRFDGLHYAAELGCSKPDMNFYSNIEARTGFRPEDLFFIDDNAANVSAAIQCGWAAAVWTGKDTVRALAPSLP